MAADDGERSFPEAAKFARAFIRSFLKAILIAVFLLSVAVGLALFMEPERAMVALEDLKLKFFLLYLLLMYGWAGAIRKLAIQSIGEVSALGAILFSLLLFASLAILDMVFGDYIPNDLLSWPAVIFVTFFA